ncbi:MAG: hypothetical protein M5Z89_16225 [Olivibacter sp.]|nr:hypothetical protein [Olivibacter sp. UJ_SKK_5.1]
MTKYTWVLKLLILVGIQSGLSTIRAQTRWIRPNDVHDVAKWGIRQGIVFSLWPYGLEDAHAIYGGGPRGLIRVGVERSGKIYLLNFLAIEPLVDGKIEFSEISPSSVDNRWGKIMWASDHPNPTAFYPTANCRGVISHPDDARPELEELSIYVFLEKYHSGAHPYLKLSIRSDRPDELAIQLFNREDSKQMDYCNITATMGNYARLRSLHLKEGAIDSRVLYKGYNGIDFIEKESYPASSMLRSLDGSYFAFATGNEDIEALKAWPVDSLAKSKLGWRYRPPLKFTQYWRSEQNNGSDNRLMVRVNGRYRYWSGGSRDSTHYMKIPGGAAFENFELRQPYQSGQKIFFGISERTPQEILDRF